MKISFGGTRFRGTRENVVGRNIGVGAIVERFGGGYGLFAHDLGLEVEVQVGVARAGTLGRRAYDGERSGR